jgi:hypothetical protein
MNLNKSGGFIPPFFASKKPPVGGFKYACLRFVEHIFAETADRADPIFWYIFPGCAGRYTVVGIADCRIIDITAGTFVHVHRAPFLMLVAL